jgi:DGQHR domain-containing protein
LEAIAKFIRSNPNNTIPNNILLAFDDRAAQAVTFNSLTPEAIEAIGPDLDNGCDGAIEWGSLEFSHETDNELPANEHLKTALVIDGQHRLLGIAKQEEDLPVLLVAILNCSPAEQAFQFIVINNKAVKVPTQNVKGIIADFGRIEGELNDRLLAAGVPFGKRSPLLHEIDNEEESPFRHLLNWPSNREGSQLVPLTAVEQCLSLYTNVFNKIKDDEDSQRSILFAIFNAVKERYGDDLWGQNSTALRKNYLMKKVSLNALNELFIERFKFMVEYNTMDIFDPTSVGQQTANIIQKIPPAFWTTTWTIDDDEEELRVQDNANVRGLIKKDMETIIENVNNDKDWFSKLKLIRANNQQIIEAESE